VSKLAVEEIEVRGVEWLRSQTRRRRGQCRCQDPSRTSSERSPRRSGRKLANGQEAGSPGSTGSRAGRSQTARLQVVPRGLPRGFTNRRQGTSSPGSTFTGRRIGSPLSAGGVGARRRLGITSSGCALSGRPSRRSSGQRGGGGGKGEEPVQDPGPSTRGAARRY